MYMSKQELEKRFNLDGSENPKYIDLLDEDKPLAGQKFACISFVSPEEIIKQKNLFFFQEFLKHWDFTKSVQKFSQFLNFLSYKYDMNFNKLMADFEEFTKTETDKLLYSTICDDYKNLCEETIDILFDLLAFID